MIIKVYIKFALLSKGMNAKKKKHFHLTAKY